MKNQSPSFVNIYLSLGRQIITYNPLGDGNCLSRMILYSMYGTEKKWKKVMNLSLKKSKRTRVSIVTLGNFGEDVAWAFAHYSYFWFEMEKYEQMIVDIQGSKCHFTYLQVCTVNGTDCSVGNMGLPAIVKFFVMHQCNKICKALHLDLYDIPPIVMEKIVEDSLLMDKFESTVFGSPVQVASNPPGKQKTSLNSDVSRSSVSEQVEVNSPATQDLQIVKQKSQIKLVDPIVKNIRPSSRRPNTRAKNDAQKKLLMDWVEVFAPVIKFVTIRITLVLAVLFC
ncbi:hypothetical protein MP228_010542 [Amoeboaphelidium protococcarum]|nr:hypothetical protein MP228_010542 [Amoeboaphelidium protococcarum]